MKLYDCLTETQSKALRAGEFDYRVDPKTGKVLVWPTSAPTRRVTVRSLPLGLERLKCL